MTPPPLLFLHPSLPLLSPSQPITLCPSPLQLAHLTRCFTDVMRRHHAAQMGFREKIKAQIQRQLKIGEGVEPRCDWLSVFIYRMQGNLNINKVYLYSFKFGGPD